MNYSTTTYETEFSLNQRNTRDVVGDYKQSDSFKIKATGSITYSMDGEDIKITKFSGSWTPLASYVTISNREVWGYQGTPFPSSSEMITRYPSSNSFNYDTGWGYVYCYPQTSDTGPRLITYADAHITGMSETYTLQLTVKVE